MTVKETTFTAKTYLVWRKEIAMSDITNKDMWMSAFKKVHEYAGNHNLKITGPGTALYLTWDMKSGKTEIGIGHPVEGGEGKVDDPELSLVPIPESKAAWATLHGDYEGLKTLHASVMAYVKEQNLETAVAVEEYTIDPSLEPDPKDWVTNVYYVCK